MTTRLILQRLLVTLLFAGGGGHALAQDAQHAEALAGLTDADYAVREAALEVLLTDDTLTPEVIAGWIKDGEGEPSPEREYRLLDAMRHHAVRRFQEQLSNVGDPASLGIQNRAQAAGALPDLAEPTVLVVDTLPGFPAYGRLRPDDVIVRFDGQGVGDPNDDNAFRRLIQQHTAGETVTIRVRRDGAPATVEVPLSSSRALTLIYTLKQPTLQPEFAARWNELRHELLALDTEQAAEAVEPDAEPTP